MNKFTCNAETNIVGTLTVTKIFEPTMSLRMLKQVVPLNENSATEVKVLQQAWRCRNTGDIEWRAIPEVSGGDNING